MTLYGNHFLSGGCIRTNDDRPPALRDAQLRRDAPYAWLLDALTSPSNALQGAIFLPAVEAELDALYQNAHARNGADDRIDHVTVDPTRCQL